jgi:ATP-dependent Zn protease
MFTPARDFFIPRPTLPTDHVYDLGRLDLHVVTADPGLQNKESEEPIISTPPEVPVHSAATAYHEAGHAVMTLSFGRAFKRISMVEDDHALARVVGKPVGEWFRPDVEISGRMRRRIEQDIIIGWGGCEAEARFVGEEDLDTKGCRGDIDHLAQLADYVVSSPQEAEAFLEWLRLRTVNALERWWYRVEAIADALKESDILSYQETKAIVAAADEREVASHPVFGQRRPDAASE